MARHQCPGGCGLACPNRGRRRAVPQAVTTHKVPGGPGLGRWVTVNVLPASNRGRNARSTSAALRGWGGSPPKGAKRAKKQNTAIKGALPRISSTRWGF